jgi:hypothetical protein
MSGEKKRRRWRRDPVLIEENITIDSTTTTTRTEERKHIESTVCKWYNNDEDDNVNTKEIPPILLIPNETVSEKIDRVLRRINAWTNETSSTTSNTNNNIQREPLQDASFNKTDLSGYDNIRQRQSNESHFSKPTYNSLLNSIRRRCCSSTYGDPNVIQTQQIPAHRPYSMTFIDEPLPMTTKSCRLSNREFYEGQNRKVRKRID